MRDAYDVAVVGAGPGGSAAAYYLSKRGLGVALLDRAAFPRDKTCGDGLTPRAVGVLQDIGILDDLLAIGQRIGGVEIVAPDGYALAASVPARGGLAAPMLIVPRVTLDDALRRRAVGSGARFEGETLVTNIQQSTHGVVVSGRRAGRPFVTAARLCIIATGASTALLARLGLIAKAPQMMLAARAYYDGTRLLDDRIQIRFDGVPLPGYGWVFPLSATSANVGVGYFPRGFTLRRRPPNAGVALQAFVRGRGVTALLDGARRAGSAKGYPLRVDFPEAATSRERVLLVGEAAGLVNPLTGEGIDYALESAQIAAECAAGALSQDRPAGGTASEYDQAVRARFGRLFTFCRRVRDASLSARLLDGLVRVASRREDLKMRLIDIVLGNQEVSSDLSIPIILKKAYALLR
jgi:geranylgeranyl reductase family protein